MGFNQKESNFEAFGIMNVMYDGITIAFIIIVPQSGIKDAIESSEKFNPKATGIATVTATRDRLEYGGSVDDCVFLELVLKKRKEGVDITFITLDFVSTPLHSVLFLMVQFWLH